MTTTTDMRTDPVRELCRCLSFAPTPEATAALRLRLAAGGWAGVLDAAKERWMHGALAAAVRKRGLAAGIPAMTLPDGRATISKGLADAEAQHDDFRARKLDRLAELVLILNGAGIEPILLKGARSLWTGSPTWRAMGDLDILTPGRAREAQQLALAAGYAPDPSYDKHPEIWHHELNLYRDDLPGWLEFHDKAAMYRADMLLPTPFLVAQSLAITGRDGGVARVLPAHIDLIYCMLHHHISHRGDKFGFMRVKGLYEFAGAVAALDEGERAALRDLTLSHPRLLAIFDLWMAAAHERFDLPAIAELPLREDAVARWRAIDGEEYIRGNYDGVAGEFRLGLSPARLRVAKGGDSWLGRMRLRAKIIHSLFAPAIERSRE